MIGQHDAARANPHARCHRCYLPDHDIGRRAGNVCQIVMFGQPIAYVPRRSASRARSSELRSATEPGVAEVTGDRSRTESGITRSHYALLTPLSARHLQARVNPSAVDYWGACAVAPVRLDCAGGAVFFTA